MLRIYFSIVFSPCLRRTSRIVPSDAFSSGVGFLCPADPVGPNPIRWGKWALGHSWYYQYYSLATHTTGRRLSPPHAAELLRQKEVRMLGEAGWEPVEVEGERCTGQEPSSGRLYPRGGAHDLLLLSTVEEGG
jgi:hypothetical protein